MNVKRKLPGELCEVKPQLQRTAVADAIRRLIALGRYDPGDLLPTQRILAAHLGVGRMTLRAAIRQLEKDGLLKTTFGRSGGTVVMARQAPMHIRKEYLAKCITELHENYEFRQAVEPHAALLCAERATKKQREIIARIANQNPGSMSEYRTLDSQFHAAIAEFCGNQLLIEAIQKARTAFFVWVDPLLMEKESFSDDKEASIKQHKVIADAIVKGVPSRAWHEMVAHLHNAEESFLKHIDDAKLLQSIYKKRVKPISISSRAKTIADKQKSKRKKHSKKSK